MVHECLNTVQRVAKFASTLIVATYHDLAGSPEATITNPIAATELLGDGAHQVFDAR